MELTPQELTPSLLQTFHHKVITHINNHMDPIYEIRRPKATTVGDSIYYLTLREGRILVSNGAHSDLASAVDLDPRIYSFPDRGELFSGIILTDRAGKTINERWSPAFVVAQHKKNGSVRVDGNFETTRQVITPMLDILQSVAGKITIHHTQLLDRHENLDPGRFQPFPFEQPGSDTRQ